MATTEQCRTCLGRKKNAQGDDCPRCHGSGTEPNPEEPPQLRFPGRFDPVN